MKLIHFTRGGIWHGRSDAGFEQWLDELGHLLAANNPKALVDIKQEAKGAPVVTHLTFSADRSEVN